MSKSFQRSLPEWMTISDNDCPPKKPKKLSRLKKADYALSPEELLRTAKEILAEESGSTDLLEQSPVVFAADDDEDVINSTTCSSSLSAKPRVSIRKKTIAPSCALKMNSSQLPSTSRMRNSGDTKLNIQKPVQNVYPCSFDRPSTSKCDVSQMSTKQILNAVLDLSDDDSLDDLLFNDCSKMSTAPNYQSPVTSDDVSYTSKSYDFLNSIFCSDDSS